MMMAGNSEKGFFAAHWDWLLAIAGFAALVVGIGAAVVVCGDDLEEAALEARSSIVVRKDASAAPAAVDLKPYEKAIKAFENPVKVITPAESDRSFLASGRRVFCEAGDSSSGKKGCGRPIPFGVKVCTYADCGIKQPAEVKINLDSDGDGLPDEYEIKFGLDPKNAADAGEDKDGDGFTNAEEFAAGTDPADPKSHPDYLDSLKIVLPLKETFLPFFCERVFPLPGGDNRFYFKDPRKKNQYGQRGLVYDMKTGEDIGKTGYKVKSYEKKTARKSIESAGGEKRLEHEVDVSEVTIERKSDKKTLRLVVGDNKRKIAVDAKATLVYERNGTKEFTVVPGDTIELNLAKYKVIEIKSVGKGAKVTLENPEFGRRTLQALEQ